MNGWCEPNRKTENDHPTKRPTNISNFGVGKYRTNPKNTILLTLASVNIFVKDEFEEEIFYVIFSCLSFIIICPF
jgi:hypothetical protein